MVNFTFYLSIYLSIYLFDIYSIIFDNDMCLQTEA